MVDDLAFVNSATEDNFKFERKLSNSSSYDDLNDQTLIGSYEPSSDEDNDDVVSVSSLIFDFGQLEEEEEENLSETEYADNIEERYQDFIYAFEGLHCNTMNCVGGRNTQNVHGAKSIKNKYKKERFNKKRRIHHRKMKQMLEEEMEKMDRIKPYYPPQITYREPEHRHTHNHHHSEEERQLHMAISNSIQDSQMNDFARECGLDYQTLLSLTQRDLTSDDYELLLAFDNTVKKKTVSCDILESLPTTVLSFDEKIEGMPELCDGDVCTTCLCDYVEGDEVRWIPQCAHIFHKSCIDEWLQSQSVSCPICRLELS